MPCAFIARACSALSRIASRPPCTRGCRVLTRPSIISGKSVSSETSLTFRPAAAIALAVPPVDTSSMPWPARARANSISPVLSETDNKARITRRGWSVMARSYMAGPPGSMVLPATKPAKAAMCRLGQILQRQFRLAARAAFGWRGGGRCLRSHEAPADRGSVAGILPDHDLGGAAGAVVPRQEYAVFQFDLVVGRLESPDVAVRQHQHHAAPIAAPAGLHRRMQVKPHRVVGLVALDAGARGRRHRVLAVEPGAVTCGHQRPAMQHAETRQIAVMRCGQ